MLLGRLRVFFSASVSFLIVSRSVATSVSCFVSTPVELNATIRLKRWAEKSRKCIRQQDGVGSAKEGCNRREYQAVRLLQVSNEPIDAWSILRRSRQGQRLLAASHEVLDNVTADKPGAADNQAFRLLFIGFRIDLAD